ncbi:MAG: helix-turn-helix domain-containing protein [Actinomycetota bacterium]
MTRRDGSVNPLTSAWTWMPVDVAADRRLIDSDRRVMIALCSFANKRRQAYPSQAAIAERSGLSVSTVGRSLKRLSVAGWVSWSHHYKLVDGKKIRGSNLYTVHGPDSPSHAAPEVGSEEASDYWADHGAEEAFS